MCALVKIECRTLRRACIWRLESEGCCEVSTAGLTPSCETCGSQSHRLACLGGILLRHFAILWNTILCLRDKDWVESELCVMRSCFEDPASGARNFWSHKTLFCLAKKIFQSRGVHISIQAGSCSICIAAQFEIFSAPLKAQYSRLMCRLSPEGYFKLGWKEIEIHWKDGNFCAWWKRESLPFAFSCSGSKLLSK